MILPFHSVDVYVCEYTGQYISLLVHATRIGKKGERDREGLTGNAPQGPPPVKGLVAEEKLAHTSYLILARERTYV